MMKLLSFERASLSARSLLLRPGVIKSWLIREGDPVKKGQAFVEIQSDMYTLKLNSPHDGQLVKQRARVGDAVPMNSDLIADISVEGQEAKVIAAQWQREKTPRVVFWITTLSMAPLLYGSAYGLLDPANAGGAVRFMIGYATSYVAFWGASYWGLAAARYHQARVLCATPRQEMFRMGAGLGAILTAAHITTLPAEPVMSLVILSMTSFTWIDMLLERKGLAPPWLSNLKLLVLGGTVLSLGLPLYISNARKKRYT